MEIEPAVILIADDNPDILRLIQVNLNFEGYETIIAENGRQALECARIHLPDLVILDVLMPEMDGWQVLSNLKSDKRTKDIPVIMLTGVSMKEGKERGLIEGVEDYLSKPFNPLRLLEIVDDVISNRKKIHRPAPESEKPLRVAVISRGDSGIDMTRTLAGYSMVDLAGFCDVDGRAESGRLAESLSLRKFDAPKGLLGIPDLNLIIDMSEDQDPSFQDEANKIGIEVLKGLSVQMVCRLIEEQDASRHKERSLVKELNTRVKELSILNEMAQILTSPLDLWFLLDKIALLVTRITNVDACAVMMYNEEQEMFTVSNTLGLGDEFRDKVKISLSDSLAEEMMSLRRPLVISALGEWEESSPVKFALKEDMNSLSAIPLFSKERLMGFILVFSHSPESLGKEEISLLSILAGQAGIAVENAFLYESSRKKQHLVEKLLSKLIQAQEEERKRIAAEIHDTIAQSLVGIYTRIQTCISLLKKAPDQLESQLSSLKTVISDSVREVRQIIFNLRPTSLDDLGLIPSLENYIKRFENENNIRVDFIVGDGNGRLPSSVETAIFRIIQEALTNVKKHSQGKSVLVRLSIEPKWVNLRVADDGMGFNWDEVTEKFLRGDSHGIQGMKERVSMLGGAFKVSTEEERGCVISASIPLNIKDDKSFIEKHLTEERGALIEQRN